MRSPIVMDHVNIPACALNRQSTTVIVRVKMEVSSICCRCDGCPAPEAVWPEIVHRPSGCERCSRTRLVSKYSDCDSGLVGKCRPYKSSAARSRYVNVCAAVCLLLLVGGLSPKSSAAPHKSPSMEDQRHRREMEENYLWRNPCSYNDTISGGTYTPKMAKNVAQQAKQAYEQAVAYKEKVAKWHSFDSYDSLLKEWRDNWLKKFPWFTTELPLPDDQYAVEEYLPELYKALKMVVAGLHKLSQSLEADGINEDNELAGHISNTMKDVRAVLCYFFDLMIARNLEMMPVYDSEVPEIDKSNKLEIGLYIYRDTIDYLQYLSTVFQKMSESSQ